MHYRCSDDVPFITADDFEKNLRYVLDEIHSKIPRVFVNLVEVFNGSMVRTGTICSLEWDYEFLEKKAAAIGSK